MQKPALTPDTNDGPFWSTDGNANGTLWLEGGNADPQPSWLQRDNLWRFQVNGRDGIAYLRSLASEASDLADALQIDLDTLEEGHAAKRALDSLMTDKDQS
jgi:hypothetical protein